MTPDKIGEIETYNDPNSCYQPNDEPLYTITDWDNSKLAHQNKSDVIEYVKDELATASFYIQKAEEENDEDTAFEVAKKYLDQFSALQEEETDEFI
ncbi:hypothetical protein QFF56_02865 [Ligilactobacillus animalis]|uniref:Uncharacterized protein n=1 Tax=Ligilactobacillus animalis TaxID=1605 RepID=A0AAJ6FZ41_9LACO|nr:hypothetical protein [Ligilactobacillus animalis]WHQ80641.1 hypothetical protein QFF56_02865 [Ligilactobacillus animalis]